MPGSSDPEEKWLAEVIKANEAMKARSRNGEGASSSGAGAGSSAAAPSSPSSVPRSVRNAPSEMRTEIRRNQNREVSSELSKRPIVF